MKIYSWHGRQAKFKQQTAQHVANKCFYVTDQGERKKKLHLFDAFLFQRS